MVGREAGRQSEMKNAGLGTGMAGGIKVLWDQVLLTEVVPLNGAMR